MRKTRTVSAIMIAFLLTLTGVTQANARLISEKQELSMGRQAARQVESQYPVSKDQQMNELVRTIGVKAAAVSSRPGITWNFKVLESKEVNALSVPGYVYVNSGLIDFVNGNKDELAAVIAHEIGHTTGRHAVKQAEKSMIGGTIIGLIFRGGGANYASLFANLALLGYSRKDEYDADKRGVQYASKAGYDPNGMVRFFERLKAKESGSSGGLTKYFRTHPPTDDRIKRAKTEIAALK